MQIKQFQPKKQTAKQLLEQFSKTSFQARQLGIAFEIWKEMIKKRAKIVLTLSGALVPAGLRVCIVECIKSGWIDALVSTGANITHDLAIGFGEQYLIWKGENDKKLRKMKASRIYDIISPDKSSIRFEKEIQKILSKLKGEYSPSQLLEEIGKRIKDKDSIVFAASKKKIPIYCPAFTDSILGLQLWVAQQDHDLKINETADLQRIIDWIYNIKKKKSGVIILGGGVPKNFALQAALIPGKPYDYGIQITTDAPQWGGLSGASLKEAISWGKVKEKAKTACVFCDATIVFPLLVSGLKEEKER